jgi:hypothetical protein
LRRAVPDKFKGTNLSQKHQSHAGANKVFDTILAEATKVKATYNGLARPMAGVQAALVKCVAKLNTLNAHSTQEQFNKFYSEEFRAIGAQISLLRAVNKDPAVAQGIAAFQKPANLLNSMLNGGTFNAAEAHNLAESAVTALTKAVG